MCNFIYKILHFIFARVMFLTLILVSPLFFLMAGGGCANAKKETVEFYNDVWLDLNE